MHPKCSRKRLSARRRPRCEGDYTNSAGLKKAPPCCRGELADRAEAAAIPNGSKRAKTERNGPKRTQTERNGPKRTKTARYSLPQPVSPHRLPAIPAHTARFSGGMEAAGSRFARGTNGGRRSGALARHSSGARATGSPLIVSPTLNAIRLSNSFASGGADRGRRVYPYPLRCRLRAQNRRLEGSAAR